MLEVKLEELLRKVGEDPAFYLSSNLSSGLQMEIDKIIQTSLKPRVADLNDAEAKIEQVTESVAGLLLREMPEHKEQTAGEREPRLTQCPATMRPSVPSVH